MRVWLFKRGQPRSQLYTREVLPVLILACLSVLHPAGIWRMGKHRHAVDVDELCQQMTGIDTRPIISWARDGSEARVQRGMALQRSVILRLGWPCPASRTGINPPEGGDDTGLALELPPSAIGTTTQRQRALSDARKTDLRSPERQMPREDLAGTLIGRWL